MKKIISFIPAGNPLILYEKTYYSIADLLPEKQSKEEFKNYSENFYPVSSLSRKAMWIDAEDSNFDIYLDKAGNIIIRREELYPCFDAFDRMNETRYYRRYLVCKTEEEAISKYKYIKENNEKFNEIEYNSPELAPLVYCDSLTGGYKIMLRVENDKELELPFCIVCGKYCTHKYSLKFALSGKEREIKSLIDSGALNGPPPGIAPFCYEHFFLASQFVHLSLEEACAKVEAAI